MNFASFLITLSSNMCALRLNKNEIFSLASLDPGFFRTGTSEGLEFVG